MPVNKYTWQWLNQIAVNHTADTCLVWPFARGKDGRGATWTPGTGRRGGWRSAHTVVCEVVHGPRPTPLHEVAHSCGKGHEGCVAPCHVHWATHTENVRDKLRHGTLYEGVRHHKAQLTKSDAIYVLQSDLSGVELARYFGVTPTAICLIRKGHNWKSAWRELYACR